VTVQNAGKVEARKREDVLEQERAAAEKKMWAEQQKKDNDEKKKRAKEELQRKLVQEERKREDKIQFDNCLAKTLEIEGSKTGAAPVKTAPRKDMTSAEMDQEFRELNAAQMRVNTRAAVDQIVGSEVTRMKKAEKCVIVGKRMMRTEEGTEEGNRLPPIALILSAGSKVNVLEPQKQGVENTKTIKEKKGRKISGIPERVVEEMDVEGGEEDFGIDQRTEVVVEMPLDLPGRQDVVDIEGPVEALSSTFLQDVLSDRMEMGKEYDLRVQEIVQDLEESGIEVGLMGSPSRSVKEELIEREQIYRDSRKGEDGKISSESAEVVEKIIIVDSSDGDSFMVRTVGLRGCSEDMDQPEPLGEISTPPVDESTPCDERIMRREEGKARPQYVGKKKLWVEPNRTIKEGRNTSSDVESVTSRQSTMSKRYVKRRAVGDETRDGAPNYAQQRPRGFGARHIHVRVKQDPDTGLHVVSAVWDDEEGLATGAEGDGVRVVSARSWLGGGELVRGGDLRIRKWKIRS